ncbi:MAG: hypothetical protein PWQ20_109 [Thermotogaceae bacterium]|jgi:hypothetical protein|nr:hypothetical protein [Thermotogaceae bacterium]MDN5337039.1 hypothetical protein [Thermotogaceae bacterium]
MKKILFISILSMVLLILSSCTGLVSMLWNVAGLWDVLLDTDPAIVDYQAIELNLTKTGNDLTGNATVTAANEITNQVTGKATNTSLHIEIVTSNATITIDGTMTAADEFLGTYLLETTSSSYTGDCRGNKR